MSPTALITAAEGFPALERLVAGAERELMLSFRILDPDTRLRAPELRERGLRTWGDLIAWTSRRGVKIRMLLADFDPLFTSELHRKAWAASSGFADVVHGDAQILCAPHGQRAGSFWRVLMRGRINRALQQLRDEDSTRHTPIQRAILKAGPILRPATIHQKFAIADDSHCIIGGLDVNERRYDDAEHDQAPEETWHDISVELTDTDFAGALQGHFSECWNAAIDCGAASLAAPAERYDTATRPQSRSNLKLIRTFSAPCPGAARLAPRPLATDHEMVLTKFFASARDHIYIETQFLRHAPLVDAMIAASKTAQDLQLVVVIPAAPDRVLFDGDHGWDARHAHGLQIKAIDRLKAAFGDRAVFLSPAQPKTAQDDGPKLAGAGPIYVHSKVTIIDGERTIIGSANLNGRSLRWDSEASVMIQDKAFAAGLLSRLGTYWMEPGAEDKPLARAETWRASAEKAAQSPPEKREGYLLPFPLEAGRAFGRTVPLLPDDMF
ncbi:phospholipase D family protein [Primorskyibacter sp. 2E107]|uniref:phospholipase D family protein n=1 Tax=Primorskyibacter sp. 2E107 TaxID=3403458 RepID=UPI003AF83F2F